MDPRQIIERKARALIAQGRVIKDGDNPGTFWVSAGGLGKPFRVWTDASPSGSLTIVECNCPLGLRAADRSPCTHAVATVMAIREQAELPERTELPIDEDGKVIRNRLGRPPKSATE